jgi:hypothetical protein
VTFRYKQDPEGERQYGLIAEEVVRLYPELVSYDADGKVVTVRYHELVPMLLNEVQKQRAENQRQTSQIGKLSAQLAEMRVDRNQERAQRAALEQRLSALERTIAADGRAAKFATALER